MKLSVWIIHTCLLLTPVLAQSSPNGAVDPDHQRQTKLLREYYLSRAGEFRMASDQSPDQPFQLRTSAVMTWTADEPTGFASGEVFVWTQHGRAETIGCIGSTQGAVGRQVFVEFHSLSSSALRPVRITAEQSWKPKRAGVKWKPIPGGRPAASTAAKRKLELRRIAREFSAGMLDDRAEDRPDQLRLLSTPIFRYDGEALKKASSDVVDGALFAFVFTGGTDPEVVLAIEARRTDDVLRWHYAPVRFTHRQLWLNHKENRVWAAPNDSGHDYVGPYMVMTVREFTWDEIQREVKLSKSR